MVTFLCDIHASKANITSAVWSSPARYSGENCSWVTDEKA